MCHSCGCIPSPLTICFPFPCDSCFLYLSVLSVCMSQVQQTLHLPTALLQLTCTTVANQTSSISIARPPVTLIQMCLFCVFCLEVILFSCTWTTPPPRLPAQPSCNLSSSVCLLPSLNFFICVQLYLPACHQLPNQSTCKLCQLSLLLCLFTLQRAI